MSDSGLVLVTGATGTVGRFLVRLLAEKGVPVRAASRNPPERVGIDDGVEVARVDLRDPTATETALESVERVFLVTPLEQDMAAVAARVINQARRAGVAQVVRLSAFGAGGRAATRLAAIHEETETILRTCGVPWVTLRPNAFMQNVVAQFADAIRRSSVFCACQGSGRVSMIDARDVAAAAAHVLTESPLVDGCFELTGPEALSNHDVAQVLSGVLERDIRYVDVQPAETRATLLAHGTSAWVTDIVMELYALSSRGGAAAVTSDAVRLLGRAPNSFETFAADYADVFR